MKNLFYKTLAFFFVKTRYFIITFQWEMDKGRTGYGELSRIDINYPKRDFLITSILEQRKTLTKVIIINIRELSKKDFTSYSYK